MTEMTSVQQDFANAISVDHLTNEQIEIVENIFKNYK